MTLQDYVNFKLTHADKVASAEGYPLTMQNCKKYKKMRDLKVYGNSLQDGTPTPENPIEVQSVGKLVTDTTDVNYGMYKIPVVQRGINLFSMAKVNAESKTVSGLTFTPLDDERVYVKGTATANVYYYMYAKATKNMVLKSGTYKSKPAKKSGISILFTMRYMDGTGAGNINSIHSGVTYDNDIYIESALIYVAKGTVMDDIIELQLMEGNQNLPYEPYVEPVTTNIFLDEPLRKLGDYADYVDLKENKVLRNVKEIDGNSLSELDIYAYSRASESISNCYRMIVYGIMQASAWERRELLCSNMLPYGEYVGHKLKTSIGISEGSMIYFRFDDEDNYGVTDIATCRSFLTNYNPLVYYVLNKPTEEPLNIDLPKLKANTTIIEVDASLAPSNAYGKYIKK